ncbi:N-acetyltransferase [Paraglaciecola sp. L3A3]|uniref:GNAT family N-acetyltransferase n=1 Tax=Paraglaciecola sp. L3A3 TaxID=2686358 RepID=UPI0018EED997|nr:GNAT family N-acetyltransferase [Paraglaciecola sp. L3A3]
MKKHQLTAGIKIAELENLQGVTSLFNDYRMFYQQESDLTLAEDFISARIKNQDSVIFIAQNTQLECLGFCQLYPSFSSVSAQKTWILNDLFVTEALRGQGIATKLLTAAKTHAKQTQTKGITLLTAEKNVKHRNCIKL